MLELKQTGRDKENQLKHIHLREHKELNNHKKTSTKFPPRVLKEVSEQLAMPLCILFNKSLESRLIPGDLKVNDVTAIFKKGTKFDAGNQTC